MINAQTEQSVGCQCPACQKTLHASDCAVHNAPAYPVGECDCGTQPYPENFIDALKYDVAKRDSEFFTHNVEQAYDWSEWVCPDPKGYLMKCCDCGLVHEAEFGVVRYKSETEREDCDMVDDPNLQAVFRMRRNEQWSPKDTAYRPGGLAQPEQEPVAKKKHEPTIDLDKYAGTYGGYTTPPQRKPLTHEQRVDLLAKFEPHKHEWHAPAILIDMVEFAHGITGENK